MEPAIGETDLHAYIDGQLDEARIPAVEAYLAAHPQEAEKLKAYARQRGEIAAALAAAAGPAPLQTERLRRRLEGVLGRRRFRPLLGRVAAAALLIAVGWGGNEASRQFDAREGVVPVFADEAAEAHSTVASLDLPLWEILRAPPAELADYLTRHGGRGSAMLHTVRIEGLTALGAQLVPWDHGTALQFVFEDGETRHRVTLFVAIASGDDQVLRTARVKGVPVAFWQKGRVVYALSGDLSESDLVYYAHEIDEATDAAQG
ncbi:anti-sigma factor family protein [Oceanibaculum pacificum]|uniref:Zinc-finger domain-containing protein n=1 Tax=Oceanibaculum pacificum TaxID=580166 RepID=A0A154VFH3_9PROT|nr:hypothetical protein [Oceanibaculum pacificum]KZD00018.1 hypothetical protein AUP43_14425 [Oceanibaculum pacificum]